MITMKMKSGYPARKKEAAADRFKIRTDECKKLLKIIEKIIKNTEKKTTDPNWADVGSMGHLREQLIAIVVTDRCSAEMYESDVRLEILKEINATD